MQGFHVMLTINAEGSRGADVKHKVFWVTGCVVPPTTTTAAPTTTAGPPTTTVCPTTTTLAPTTTVKPTTTTAKPTTSTDKPKSLAPAAAVETSASHGPTTTVPPTTVPTSSSGGATSTSSGCPGDADLSAALTGDTGPLGSPGLLPLAASGAALLTIATTSLLGWRRRRLLRPLRAAHRVARVGPARRRDARAMPGPPEGIALATQYRLGDAEVAVVANQIMQRGPVRIPAPDPVPAEPSSPEVRTALTVVLPCYNEAERLPGTLRAYLRQLSWAPGEVEVLVVDDGSTDATRAVAEAVAATGPRVRVLGHRPNRGKGFAVRAGMLAGRGDLVVFADADGSYGPGDLQRVVEALAEAPVAIFSRTRLDGFAFDVEVLFLAGRLGLEVAQVGVQARECEGSKVRVAVDAPRMLRDVLAVRRLAASGAYGGLLAGHGQPKAVSN